MQKIYLSNTDPDEALEIFLNEFEKYTLETETIDTINSLDRITSDSVFSKNSSPNFNASAMDGAAVISANTFGADETTPKILYKGIDFILVDTGDPIIEPFDSVIMIEDIVFDYDGNAEIIKPATPWQHIRPIGEDIVSNEMILQSLHKIRAVDINALLSGGVLNICVYKQLKVGIIPTGDEIVEPTNALKIGEINESNSRMFEAQLKKYNCLPKRYPICNDRVEDLKKAVLKASYENDIVIVNAGSSAGREDYTSTIVSELGKLLVHGVSIKPGKPTVLGSINNKPFIGIPGYPVASYIVFEYFVKPLISKITRKKINTSKEINCYLSKRIISSIKNLEFVPVKLGIVNNKKIATPLNRGSGVTMSLVRADGILKIEKSLEGYEAGDLVSVEQFEDREDIEKTLVSIGSHDLIMDLIGNELYSCFGFYLSSSHVGSFGGITALKKGETHLAPIHILDEDTGTYNIASVKKYFPNEEMVLIKGVKRLQGLIVKKNNPLNIKSIDDVYKNNFRFVNRQRGAGTRILTDFLLKKFNFKTEKINGYDREMNTHMAVAAAVESDSADVGVGVFSVAKTLDLEFVEIGFEDYDFLIRKESLNDEKIINFISILKSEIFHKKLDQLGGYDFLNSGEIIFV